MSLEGRDEGDPLCVGTLHCGSAPSWPIPKRIDEGDALSVRMRALGRVCNDTHTHTHTFTFLICRYPQKSLMFRACFWAVRICMSRKRRWNSFLCLPHASTARVFAARMLRRWARLWRLSFSSYCKVRCVSWSICAWKSKYAHDVTNHNMST